MPKQYPCDLCESNLADFTISAVATGDTQLVCVRCLPVFTEAVVSAIDQLEGATPPPPQLPPVVIDGGEPWEGDTLQDATTAAHEAPTADAGEWEADYPQPTVGRSRGRKSAPNGQTSADTETETATTDHE